MHDSPPSKPDEDNKLGLELDSKIATRLPVQAVVFAGEILGFVRQCMYTLSILPNVKRHDEELSMPVFWDTKASPSSAVQQHKSLEILAYIVLFCDTSITIKGRYDGLHFALGNFG